VPSPATPRRWRSWTTTPTEQAWADARAYNAGLPAREHRYQPTGEETARYQTLLNIASNGVMGYVGIPAIHVSLPIYHGVNEAVLQVAIGHIEGSSLPVGGESTHCVISGNRGLPSARLFTDLDKLTVGDEFYLRVLDEKLAYEVDQIRIVEPHELELLEIEPGQDLCTLVTCTPYGANTHRLLVRGTGWRPGLRPAGAGGGGRDADRPGAGGPGGGGPLLLLLVVWVLATTRRPQHPKDQEERGIRP